MSAMRTSQESGPKKRRVAMWKHQAHGRWVCQTKNRFLALSDSVSDEAESAEEQPRTPATSARITLGVAGISQFQASGSPSKKSRGAATAGRLAPLQTVMPEGIKAVDTSGWELLEAAVDSGGTEGVLGPEVLQAIDITEGAPYKIGVS